MTLATYKNSSSSEKILLTKVFPKQRLMVWTVESGSVYKKTVPDIVSRVDEDGTTLTEVSSLVAVDGAGKWFFDRSDFTLYLWATDSNDPTTNFTTAFYEILWSTKPINLELDFTTGDVVPWLGLINSVSPTKQQLDDQQRGITIESSGSISLINDTTYWDSRFGRYIWEDAAIQVYITSPVLEIANKIQLFDGNITQKRWDTEEIGFSFRDFSFELREKIDTPLFDGTQTLVGGGTVTLTKDQLFIPQRRIYGRVKNLWPECLDNEAGGSSLTGTFSGTASSTTITSSLAAVSTELSPGDILTVTDVSSPLTIETFAKLDIGLTEGQVQVTGAGPITIQGAGTTTLDFSGVAVNDKVIIDFPSLASAERGLYNVDSKTATTAVLSKAVGSYASAATYEVKANDIRAVKEGVPTSFTIGSDVSASFTGKSATVQSSVPRRDIHRQWQIAHHICQNKSYTITGVNTPDKEITLDTVNGLRVGDTVVVDGSVKQIEEIRGNIITSVQTIAGVAPGDSFARSPIQSLSYRGQSLVEGTGFTLNQSLGDCRVILEDDAEFTGAATIQQISHELLVTNASNVVYSSTGLFSGFNSRDWISIDSGTDYYEILEVISSNCAILRTTITEATNNYTTVYSRQPEYLTDNGTLVADAYGKTDDGTATGELVENAALVVQDVLEETSVSIDSTTFTNAQADAPQLISLPVPSKRRADHPTRKTVINLINQTVQGSLVNGLDFEAEYFVFSTERDTAPRKIESSDLVEFKLDTDSKFQVSDINCSYRVQDYDPDEQSENVAEKFKVTNTDFANTDRIGQEIDLELFFYFEADADAFARRLLLMRSLARQTIEVTAATFLVDVTLNEVVELDLQNSFNRLGSSTTNRKLGIVSGVQQSLGESVVTIEDLGNIFDRTGTIAANSSADFSAADEDEKLVNAYITDDNGIVNDEDQTYGINLIQ